MSQPPKEEKPWYHRGLRFNCTECGDCCTGAPGFVWVNQAEIEAIAAQLGYEDVAKFQRKYVRKVGMRRSLREHRNGDCVLLDKTTRRCTVYEVRPRQCRTWPFWESNIRTPDAWEDTCRSCPGSGTGKLYSLEEIDAQSRIFRL